MLGKYCSQETISARVSVMEKKVGLAMKSQDLGGVVGYRCTAC